MNQPPQQAGKPTDWARRIESKYRCKLSNDLAEWFDQGLWQRAGGKTSKVNPAHKVMTTAIHKGVPLFNHGNHQACAAVYEVAAKSIMEMPMDTVSSHDKQILMTALEHCEGSHCATTRAWTMRKAFDKIMMVSN